MNFKRPDYISNSQLSAFKKSPAHWLHYITEPKVQTEAMLLGSVAHSLALEREIFLKEYFVMDEMERPEKDKDFRSTKNKEWKTSKMIEAGEKTLVTKDMFDNANNMVTALYEDSEARKFLDGQKEAKIEWSCLGFKFLGIRDISSDTYITDLKFVGNADPFAFQRDLFKFGYYRQGGMYLDGEMNGEFTGEPHKRCIFIAVENKAPYGVSVHELDFEVINDGINEYRRLAEQLKDCIDSNHFPSYQFRSISGTFDVTRPTFMPTE